MMDKIQAVLHDREYLKRIFWELFRYGVVGTITTIINIVSYDIFARGLGIQYIISTVLAWTVAVIFAFFSNKFIVFQRKSMERHIVMKEFLEFISSRIATGIVDIIIMYLGVSILHQNDLWVKTASNIITIVLNYILGKFIVFKEKLSATNGLAELGVLATTGYIARNTYIEAVRTSHEQRKIIFFSNVEIERLILSPSKLETFKKIIDNQVKDN